MMGYLTVYKSLALHCSGIDWSAKGWPLVRRCIALHIISAYIAIGVWPSIASASLCQQKDRNADWLVW
jgi:hypothetical protein